MRSGQGHLQQRQWWQSPPTNLHLVEPLPWCDPSASPHLFLLRSLCFVRRLVDTELLAGSRRRCPVSAGAGGVNTAKGRLRRWEDTGKPVCLLLTCPTLPTLAGLAHLPVVTANLDLAPSLYFFFFL